MTREEFKKHIRNLFYSSKTVEKYLEQAYTDINQIFDEHEKDIKDKDKEIERLENRVYALENDTIVQNMEQRLVDISLVINGELTSKDNA